MKIRDVCIINSYAGSLTIAATRGGFRIRGSYEDCGWGLPVQKANFPDLKYVDRPPWPDTQLDRSIVIAHPPCAAFSTQSPGKTGTASDHFKPHKLVMDYALGNRCAALAIESVPGILVAAQDIHKKFAREYDYNVYYLFQNSVTFGVPQWRPRVWTIFTKLKKLVLSHYPVVKTIGEIMMKKGTELEPNGEIRATLQRMGKAGYTEDEVYGLLNGEHIGSLLQIGKKVLDIDDAGPNFIEVRNKWGLAGMFGCKLPRVLNPEEFATTVLHDSSWFVMGRELYLEEYCRIMGFPDDYIWPGKTLKEFRLYLSKGVCPPVAKWILEELKDNLAGRQLKDLDAVRSMVVQGNPGDIMNICVTRKELKQRRLF